jgi:hypothetical protein
MAGIERYGTGTGAMNRDPRRFERTRHRRPKFAHADIDRLDPRLFEHGFGDTSGEPFEQEVVLLRCDLLNGFTDIAVVHRVVEVVGAARLTEIEVHRDVELKRLRGLALMVEHADDGHETKPTQFYAVDHGDFPFGTALGINREFQPRTRRLPGYRRFAVCHVAARIPPGAAM